MKLSKLLFVLTLLSVLVTYNACKKEKEEEPEPELGAIQGTPGNPRFNLQFTNSEKVDMDLYVQTPDGSIINYSNPSAQNGRLDVDCLCNDCPTGPNENIYWTPGNAPRGTYKVWVEYFESCTGANESSAFTLRTMNNTEVLNTYTGTLNETNWKSTVYTMDF